MTLACLVCGESEMKTIETLAHDNQIIYIRLPLNVILLIFVFNSIT